jgi:hypothetical protein
LREKQHQRLDPSARHRNDHAIRRMVSTRSEAAQGRPATSAYFGLIACPRPV